MTINYTFYEFDDHITNKYIFLFSKQEKHFHRVLLYSVDFEIFSASQA